MAWVRIWISMAARLVAHHGVQRLVAVGLGLGDVVVELRRWA
jgi:hypothetical protein